MSVSNKKCGIAGFNFIAGRMQRLEAGVIGSLTRLHDQWLLLAMDWDLSRANDQIYIWPLHMAEASSGIVASVQSDTYVGA